MEKAVQVQTMKFMENMKQWNKNLHAYRRLHSSTTAALQLTDYMIEAADNGMVANAQMVDQSAAFDCVDAKILDRKIEIYGFSPETRQCTLLTEQRIY